MLSRSRRHSHTLNIWPGFVDALSAVLMVIIFVLMTFVLSQLYLSHLLSNQDAALEQKNSHLDELTKKLNHERSSNQRAKNTIQTLKGHLAELEALLQSVQMEVTLNKDKEKAAEVHAGTLMEEISRLKERLIQDASLIDLKAEENKTLQEALEKLKERDKQSVGQFRSEFLAKMQKIVGKRNDIRVVGDRFIFQSEVFFDIASDELGAEGKNQLNDLAKTLKDIAVNIPSEVKWILRVDGHTDQRPIHNSKFPSNWDLSIARALAVVRYLIARGVPPERLVAAGFGEFQPLIKDAQDTKELARNRRIEFKLDQR